MKALSRSRRGRRVRRVGIIVNPLAGMGGRVGLKGTDGVSIVEKAKRLGASPESPRRAVEALGALRKMKHDLEVFAYPEEMGENEARACGFTPIVVGSIKTGQTTDADTKSAAIEMKRRGVDLLLFAGGDGTARDIYAAIGRGLTVLGIPAGVKMHSAVFGVTPRDAGRVAASFLASAEPNTVEGEVMDIDEASFRRGVVSARLYGYLRIPEERRFIQSAKSGGIQSEGQSVRGISMEIAAEMEEDDCLYIFGPGTTTRDILAHLGLAKTLLGVDVVLNRLLVARDANERELARLIEGTKKAKIVVTVIGGQGYLFGRGNQQLSHEILRRIGKRNVIVVATREKLASLRGRPLLVDTGDAATDEALSGYTRVITGFNEYTMYRVAS